MTVYVDDMRMHAKVGTLRARWSHLLAADREELHRFAARLGLDRRWFQEKCRVEQAEQCPHWHYDVTDSKRAEAIALGAEQITLHQAGDLMRARRAAMRAAAGGPFAPVAASVPASVSVPVPQPHHLVAEPGRTPAAYDPERQQHSWVRERSNARRCRFCDVLVVHRRHNVEDRWWQGWTWPDRRTGNNYDGGTVPRCPGPPEARQQIALLCMCGAVGEHDCVRGAGR